MKIQTMEGDCDECGESTTKLQVIDICGFNDMALCPDCVRVLISMLKQRPRKPNNKKAKIDGKKGEGK